MLALTSRKIPDSHKTAQTLGLEISFFIAQKPYKGIKTICEKNEPQSFTAFVVRVRLPCNLQIYPRR